MVYRRFFSVTDEQGQQWPVWTEDFTIGSAPGNTLVIPEPSVAAVQTRIWRAMDRCWARDEGALFGTLVNGEPVEGDQELRAGDTITVGTRQVRLLIEPLLPKHLSALPRPAREVPPESGTRIPIGALIVPIALLIVVLGAALVAGRTSRRPVALDLQWAVSNDQGVARFVREGDGDVAIEVRDEYDQPFRDVQVGRLLGRDGNYQAFFALSDGLLSGAAFFTSEPYSPLRVAPNIMYQADPDQVEALARMLQELGLCADSYRGKVGPGEAADPTKPADVALRLELHRDGQLFFGIQRAGLARGLVHELGTPAGAAGWDRYDLSFRDRSDGETHAAVLYAASQAPVMSQVDRLDTGESDEVLISFLAIDPWIYPGLAGSDSVLSDHTIDLGPTPDSDLEYYYRVYPTSGPVPTEWTSVRQEAACTRNGCQPTEVGLLRPARGTYVIEVYARDEVQNQSRTVQLPFAVGE